MFAENEFEEFEKKKKKKKKKKILSRVFLQKAKLIIREKKTRKAETTHLRNIIIVVIVFTHTRACFIT